MIVPENIQDILDAIAQNAEQAGIFNNLPTFKQWFNNKTRLNEYNMNNLTAEIQAYSKQLITNLDLDIGDVLTSIIAYNAGWKTSMDQPKVDETGNPELDAQGNSVYEAVGGEVFNDYIHNEANGLYSHAQNSNTVANGENSSAAGFHTTAGFNNQFVIGQYNENKDGNLFEVGNGTLDDGKSNAFEVRNDGTAALGVNNLDNSQIPAYDPNSADNNLVTPKGYVDKKTAYLNQEIEELKQLNEWLGSITVTSAQYHNQEEFFTKLDNAVKEFTKDTDPPEGRSPRNGDQITVDISDRTATDPQYPEIWMYKDPDPKEGEQEEDPTPGQWKFFSSLQQLVNASKTAKGLVQIGDNINVSEGLISVPIANASTLGVVKGSRSIIIESDGSMNQYWIDWA